MPSPKPDDKDETALAAEISAAHAETAAEVADKDDLAAKRAAAGAPVCPTCRGELIKHDDRSPFKIGAWHCNGCGACWAPGLKHQRTGHASG